MEKIRIVVVDDSAFMRKAISDMIESEDSFEVVAKLRDGRELIEKVEDINPDLITLDVHMRDLDGLSTLKELKRMGKSYPIIMLSSATTEGSEITLECLDNGAITFINKPSGSISLDIAKIQQRLIDEIKSITANVKTSINREAEKTNINIPKNKKIDAVVIGASTGGPKALQEVLTKLPKNLGVPVLVVQHMPEGFTKVFAERLDKVCNLKVVEAKDGMHIDKNTIYIAKGGLHMKVDNGKNITLSDDPAIWGVRPAVDKLFDSAVRVYGANLLSVILTGMGRDGADGTRNIKDNGGITIAEDKSTCTIYGMPKAAYETGKVDLVVPLDKISEKIIEIVQ